MRRFLSALALALVLVLAPGAPIEAAQATPAPRRPNIIVLVADDMGYADCGAFGGTEIPTPNLDALARDGVRFTHGYSSGCVCSPSRAGLFTGRYQQRFGFDANAEGKATPVDRAPRALDLAQVTLAQRMKSIGYRTALFGKWHLGAGDGYRPIDRGFDEFYGFYPFGIAARSPTGGPAPIYRGATEVDPPANHMEAFCAEALAFIDRHRDDPFFLCLPFPAVHGPFVGPASWLDRFAALEPVNRRKYAADLAQMDDVIGRVLARVHERALDESTLVFFFSDNGGQGRPADNGPLRGAKWTLWEGGIRVPFLARWKGRIPAGRTLDAPVIQIDVAPTAFAAAGARIDPAWDLDGVNLLPYMEGTGEPPRREALFWRFGVQYAVRQGDWKLLKAHVRQSIHLFNLARDPGEQHDLAEADPERVRRLQALWETWNTRNEAPRWIDRRWDGDGPRPKGKPGKGGKGKRSG